MTKADKSTYVAPGLLEAMCIQIPERTGRKLVSLVPGVVDRRDMGDAVRQNEMFTQALNRNPTCSSTSPLHLRERGRYLD